MREIKFRAWQNEQERMIPDFLNEAGWKGKDYLNAWYLDCYNIMQYTGLKDKNGVEIYEGDIIEFDVVEWGGSDNIHVVSWDDKNAEWCWGGGSTGDMEWRQVIGNIYENPELLGE